MVATRIRAIIMGLVMILFLGYIFIWVIFPTNLYKKNWILKIRAHTMSTYFGTVQGKLYYFSYNFIYCVELYIYIAHA